MPPTQTLPAPPPTPAVPLTYHFLSQLTISYQRFFPLYMVLTPFALPSQGLLPSRVFFFPSSNQGFNSRSQIFCRKQSALLLLFLIFCSSWICSLYMLLAYVDLDFPFLFDFFFHGFALSLSRFSGFDLFLYYTFKFCFSYFFHKEKRASFPFLYTYMVWGYNFFIQNLKKSSL